MASSSIAAAITVIVPLERLRSAYARIDAYRYSAR
jgi:hypothetical protein